METRQKDANRNIAKQGSRVYPDRKQKPGKTNEEIGGYLDLHERLEYLNTNKLLSLPVII